MIKVLLALWQLPQNLIGFFITRHCIFWKKSKTFTGKLTNVYYVNNLFRSGVSLGSFIILDKAYASLSSEQLITTISHEYGHQKQSEILGPFYFLVIGIPSFIGNIYSRLTGKDSKWYYNQPVEKWADKLGNVSRIWDQ